MADAEQMRAGIRFVQEQCAWLVRGCADDLEGLMGHQLAEQISDEFKAGVQASADYLRGFADLLDKGDS